MNTAKKLAFCCIAVLPLATMPACITDLVQNVNPAPDSFIKTMNAEWTTLPLRAGITPDQAWTKAMDIVLLSHEMEMISKETNYARSAWKYINVTKGMYTSQYRTRVIFRIAPTKDALLLKVEAQSGGEGRWVSGYDKNLLDTVQHDLNAILGK